MKTTVPIGHGLPLSYGLGIMKFRPVRQGMRRAVGQRRRPARIQQRVLQQRGREHCYTPKIRAESGSEGRRPNEPDSAHLAGGHRAPQRIVATNRLTATAIGTIRPTRATRFPASRPTTDAPPRDDERASQNTFGGCRFGRCGSVVVRDPSLCSSSSAPVAAHVVEVARRPRSERAQLRAPRP
jgi:hypothetical protein